MSQMFFSVKKTYHSKSLIYLRDIQPELIQFKIAFPQDIKVFDKLWSAQT